MKFLKLQGQIYKAFLPPGLHEGKKSLVKNENPKPLVQMGLETELCDTGSSEVPK